MNPRPAVSVVVPAHNEERFIGQSLSNLLHDTDDGEFDVVVVSNGSADRTADVARGIHGVRVIETARAGKAHALQLGHDACLTFPRLYLDADVRLSAESVRRMVQLLRTSDGVLACAPAVEWDTTECSRFARRAHFAHDALMRDQRCLSGVGAYMISEEGSHRVFPIPDIIADDEYVHRLFSPNERASSIASIATKRPAPSLRTLVSRRARARAGNVELVSQNIAVHTSHRLTLGSTISAVRQRSVRPVDALCFILTVIAERAVVLSWRLRGKKAVWTVDRNAGVRNTAS